MSQSRRFWASQSFSFLKDALNASRQSQSSRISNRFRPAEKHRKGNGRQILSDLLITLFNTSLVPP
jgi:hypothetical protein